MKYCSRFDLIQIVMLVVASLFGPLISHASSLAYEGTTDNMFGVIDFDTGVFTPRGDMGLLLSGLALAPNGELYGGEAFSNTWYKVNTLNGSLTAVGTSIGLEYAMSGSTHDAVFAIGLNGDLFSIDFSTGAASRIGATGLGNVEDGLVYGLSNGSSDLYLTRQNELYRVNTDTGFASFIGNSTTGAFGALSYQEGKLFAGFFFPLAVYNLDPSTGAGTLISGITGTGQGSWGLAPVSTVPELDTYVTLVVGMGLIYFLKRGRVSSSRREA